MRSRTPAPWRTAKTPWTCPNWLRRHCWRRQTKRLSRPWRRLCRLSRLQTRRTRPLAARGAAVAEVARLILRQEARWPLSDLPTRQQLTDQMNAAGKGDQLACYSIVSMSYTPIAKVVTLFGVTVCIPGTSVTETFLVAGSSQPRPDWRQRPNQQRTRFSLPTATCNVNMTTTSHLAKSRGLCGPGWRRRFNHVIRPNENGIPTAGIEYYRPRL